MRRFIFALCALAVTASLPAGALAQPASRTISFGDAERLALANSTAVRIADRGVQAAKYGLKAAKALRLPQAKIETNVLLWNEAIAFDLAIPGVPLPPGMDVPRVAIRDRVTSTTSLVVAMPLSTQLPLAALIDIQRAGVAGAKLERTSTGVNAAYRAADAYVAVLLARSAAKIAASRVKQLTAQMTRAESLLVGGVLQQVDVLRLRAALAAASAAAISAEANVDLARGVLVLATGLPPQTDLRVKDELPASPAPPPHGVADAVRVADGRRTELAILRVRKTQADAAARFERTKLFPNVVAIANLQRNEGAGSLQSKNAWFVGLTLSWNAWDWFSQLNKTKQARAKASQIFMAQKQARDGIHIEVRAVTNGARAAHKVLAVTRAGVKAAAESFRIQTYRFKEGAVTTTDILDAESALAQAQLAYATARYTYFRALIQLAKATGQRPSAVIGKI